MPTCFLFLFFSFSFFSFSLSPLLPSPTCLPLFTTVASSLPFLSKPVTKSLIFSPFLLPFSALKSADFQLNFQQQNFSILAAQSCPIFLHKLPANSSNFSQNFQLFLPPKIAAKSSLFLPQSAAKPCQEKSRIFHSSLPLPRFFFLFSFPFFCLAFGSFFPLRNRLLFISFLLSSHMAGPTIISTLFSFVFFIFLSFFLSFVWPAIHLTWFQI
ncbi:Uncharacterized protein TCM_031506 [Theobroma cacao]|uniref:Uncharacterized protein n=1 Tax=Theobroma cacao TaxID=3641 RepID=A0A061F7Y7_THECC|nr:Uncharacterized protein TCM_031506 [Theobroma cacao]